MFDLDHDTLARHVGTVGRFGNDAVESRALEVVEPPRGRREIAGHWREVERGFGLCEQTLQHRATFALGLGLQVLSIGGEEIERHEGRGRLLCQLRDA